ncbi:hypothetical protein AVEN_136706-1 [Araneus ventricosus]|uniref:Uncharacterized protein n=1 Tax=Araneus ventricosus TaxID=182803 RepID=A0A4Y2B8M3_ARAVE|nr:hypothetical protein AVEN_136706-1 [Araneus ventricosus]
MDLPWKSILHQSRSRDHTVMAAGTGRRSVIRPPQPERFLCRQSPFCFKSAIQMSRLNTIWHSPNFHSTLTLGYSMSEDKCKMHQTRVSSLNIQHHISNFQSLKEEEKT